MTIRIRGARTHNLQGVDVDIGDGLTVVTGVSGSGKTSLIFDTLYHESRRRYLEIFSLGLPSQRLASADVDEILGVGPVIAVEQNRLNRNPNSTLATASGLHPFFRMLFARFGEQKCARCGTPLSVLSEDEIVARLVAYSRVESLSIRAPLMRQNPGSHRTLLKWIQSQFSTDKIYIDGKPLSQMSASSPRLEAIDPLQTHDLDIEIARLSSAVRAPEIRRHVRTAWALGSQAISIHGKTIHQTLSRSPTCPQCATWFERPEPLHFHTNCPHCNGQGCQECGRSGMHPLAAATTWSGLRLTELLAMSVDAAHDFFSSDQITSSSDRLLFEIRGRLDALQRVGIGYVSLDRPSPTLSRGESQRVRLALALTNRLEDLLHVLDEPTIGLHALDVARLLPAFRELPGPVIYIEHDRQAASGADHVLDLGPGAGDAGGRLIFSGTPAELWQADTLTARYFSSRQQTRIPDIRPEPVDFLTIHGAARHNLQNLDVPIPIGRLTVITGVSGSGKSTLVEDVLVSTLAQDKPIGCQKIVTPKLKPVLVDQSPIGRNPRSNPATYTKLADSIRDLFSTATGLSATHFSFNTTEGACKTCHGMGALEVKMRYLPSTWIPCAGCAGERFTDEVLSARIAFGERWLSIADVYRLSVSEAIPLLLLNERLPSSAQRSARRILTALVDIGLGYLPLGQPSPTLSGGEAQRVKLARYLGMASLSRRLLVLDEPTTGLHPHDISGLLVVLDRLVRSGATVVVVEHNADIIRAADWVVELGPGAGPRGGHLLFTGPVNELTSQSHSLTAKVLEQEARVAPRPRSKPHAKSHDGFISVRGARAHNLRGIDVAFPKQKLTVVTGVSGSGKSSLVRDVLETEARRRFLEILSLYERQSTKEGPEADVEYIAGLGVTVAVRPERRLYDLRATVGTTTEIAHHLAALMAWKGRRRCPGCDAWMQRSVQADAQRVWRCHPCDTATPIAEPRHFSPLNYAAACQHCQGVGSMQVPNPDKLIINPERPLCDGAMYSPGFFPKGYLCKPFNHGYDMVQALAARYGFDPASTPWNQIPAEAQQSFLFGDPEPMQVTFRSRTRTSTREVIFPGFYGFIRDWDVGGTYTDIQRCPQCDGARLRPDYLTVMLGDHNIHALMEMPLSQLARELETLQAQPAADSKCPAFIKSALATSLQRLKFLLDVGAGYLHLNRATSSLSAGEAQRIKLAGILGSGLTSLTVLLDEPSRGLHPRELQALVEALHTLRDHGNTVIVVEHDPILIRCADHLVELGPGPGATGGMITASGAMTEVTASDALTAQWLRGDREFPRRPERRQVREIVTLQGARANNLKGDELCLPLETLTGVCGVSGSGKSTLLIDTLGRALAPIKHTTSVAYEPIEPGTHTSIKNAPAQTIVLDQARKGVVSPASYLRLESPLRKLFAASDDAHALGITNKSLSRGCAACNGRGATRIDMGFLPDVFTPCETCQGTGLLAEAWEVRLRGLTLPEVNALTIDEVFERFSDLPSLARALEAARSVGLGYLVLHQPGISLSGGEAQRLKIARELCKKSRKPTLYLLDEPTVGQHMQDIVRLVHVLQSLVDAGHTVVVIEHHAHVLAACDWIIELGPGGGPAGGRIIAAGTPESIAAGETPTARWLREVLEAEA